LIKQGAAITFRQGGDFSMSSTVGAAKDVTVIAPFKYVSPIFPFYHDHALNKKKCAAIKF